MLRQPKKDRCYTVETNIGVNEPEVWATNPKDAVVFAFKKNGYYVKRDNVVPKQVNTFRVLAKVCLLGGKQESKSYYGILGL